MPALNFKKQFAPKVRSGEKRQTIRARRRDGCDPKPGDKLYLYTGMRTKVCERLAVTECATSQPVVIGKDFLSIDDVELFSYEREVVAKNDGFATFHEMAAWFDDIHGLPFAGLMIRWHPIETLSSQGSTHQE